VPLTIKNPEVERLARRVAAETGESLTDAVRQALSDRLERLRGSRRAPSTFDAIMDIAARCSALPDRDARSHDEILGYDESGVFS
jgi:antitoxin VapB